MTGGTSFRESIVKAPEFSQPFIDKIMVGVQEWPFEEIEQQAKDVSSKEKVVFEARSIPYEKLNSQLVNRIRWKKLQFLEQE